jgi:hypothetical protein
MKGEATLRVVPAVLVLCACAAALSISSAPAQVACNQVGNHVIKVSLDQGSGQLVDCEGAHASKQAKHKITWQARGQDTLSIEFAPNQNPFLKFTCKNQKSCTASQIDPAALGQYKYTVTLTSGGQSYSVDPHVIIEQ